MTRRSRLASLLLVAALACAGVVAFVVHLEHSQNYGVPPELVPKAWEEFKTSAGHHVHVEEHEIACGECHDYKREGFKNPGVAPCAKCHATETARTHRGDDALHTDCLTCHAFAPASAAPAPPTCISCHARAHGASAAIAVHADVACTNCHNPHADPSIAPKDCTTCHTELTPSHADHAGSRGCLDCHTGHAPAKQAATSCSSCHASPAGPKPANHDSCLSCHKPHDFVAGGEKACIGCHALKPTLAMATVTAHDDCLNCHKPHAPMEAASSCTTCHADVHTSHPAVGGTSTCTTCHAPHADPATIAKDCTSCHSSIATSDTSAHAGATACTTCHAPHDFAKPIRMNASPAFCATCHLHEETLASTNVGHADCEHCHGSDAHRPAHAPSCVTCHAKEQASAPMGHRTCTSCHDAHSGTRGPQATCNTCHVKESHDPHSIAVGSCTSCHRAHGPSGIASPPTCTTCHARSTLAGVHVASGHATCASCHTPHEPVREDRVTCTSSCHTDKKNHEPQATACGGCHPFK